MYFTNRGLSVMDARALRDAFLLQLPNIMISLTWLKFKIYKLNILNYRNNLSLFYMNHINFCIKL